MEFQNLRVIQITPLNFNFSCYNSVVHMLSLPLSLFCYGGDGGGRGAAGGRESLGGELGPRELGPREKQGSLSLTDCRPRSIDDQSTIDRRTDHFDRSRRRSFDDRRFLPSPALSLTFYLSAELSSPIFYLSHRLALFFSPLFV